MQDMFSDFVFAILNNKYYTCDQMISKGFNINLVPKGKQSVLHYACIHGNFNAVKYLVDKGAIVNCYNDKYVTPFQFACQSGNKNIVDYIYKRSNLKHEDINKSNVMHYACLSGNPDIIRLIAKNTDFLNKENKCGDTPVHWAYTRPDFSEIKTLLMELGANTDDLNPEQSMKIIYNY